MYFFTVRLSRRVRRAQLFQIIFTFEYWTRQEQNRGELAAEFDGPCAERRIRRRSLKAGGFGREILLRTDSSGRAEAELSEGRDERVDTYRVQADTQQIDHLQNCDLATRPHKASKQSIGQ